MGVQIRVEGQPITLGDLRQIVQHTDTWPAASEVVPRGSRLDAASITVEHGVDEVEDPLAPGGVSLHNTRLGPD